MKTNNIPVTAEEPIILCNNVPSGGGGATEYDITYWQGGPPHICGTVEINAPRLELNFSNTQYTEIMRDAFKGIAACFAKAKFHNQLQRVNGVDDDNKRNETLFYYFTGTDVIFKSLVEIGQNALYFWEARNMKLYLPSNLSTIGANGIYLHNSCTLYYEGSEADWNNITGVENVTAANIVFNTPIPD